jgi:hypothetical protein
MSLRSFITLVLAFTLVAPAAHAQDQDLWRSFAEKLPPGAFVVVHLSNGSTVKGHLVQVTPATITVLPKTRLPVPARALAFADVESIDTTKEGMSPGAKVLAGVGAASAAVVLLVVVALAAGGWD